MKNYLTLRKEMLSPPGDTIQETIDEIRMSQAELARRMGRSKEKLNDLIKGREPLTRNTALLLERVLGIPLSFWINRENAYREELMRIEQEEFLETCSDWVKQFPLLQLKKMGFLPDTRESLELTDALLRFFGVASPKQWEKTYLENRVATAFKVSMAHDHSVHAISSWLRIGELKALGLKLPCYDAKTFTTVLEEIKEIVASQPEDFREQLQKKCTMAGVALTFTPGLPKAPLSGATWWMGGNPIIQLTGRHKTNDHFWFAFYHEAAHILKHSKKEIFLEDLKGSNLDLQKEQEANLYAQKFLFPQKALSELMVNTIDKSIIVEYAKEHMCHPGIIVGQLQHEKVLPFAHLNDLKVKISLFE
ncbi:ImmA/IrrE family metallo-endopeptidase [Geofilum rubicundum]|uniref:Plasmid maintenance system antidote protein n=1 Tax=Geofilum rubicundum JCM 15548 TaxID=1236989 RepID=A0A0E9M3B0_9BACT|nr:ImmA/IrrE family metallo-endopeptidase [Geofilum rubicundum]GAO31896.1 plasmid maintenance system antidote protein [Geofilum rubicundum JCM 15548]